MIVENNYAIAVHSDWLKNFASVFQEEKDTKPITDHNSVERVIFPALWASYIAKNSDDSYVYIVAGSLFEDHWKEWLPGPSLGPLYNTERR